MSAVRDVKVREARLPGDRPVLEKFVHALNLYEHAIEPDRRTDPEVGPEFLDAILKRVAENEGRIFVAERDGVIVGWIVAIVEEQMTFIREDERRIGYVSELFVEARERGGGIGRALIEKVQGDLRSRGLRRLGITALAGNNGAREAYIAWGFRLRAIDLYKDL